MFFTENHRHSSVDLGDELVGLAGYDRAGVHPLVSRGFPAPVFAAVSGDQILE
jgi:hypothetical protein